jgi:hypothetical protein
MGDEAKDVGIEITPTQGSFSSQEYQRLEASDFPNGKITDHFHLDNPDVPFRETDLPDGKYYIEDFPFNLALGDDLKEVGPRPAEVLTAGQDNGLLEVVDIYTGIPFAEGQKVAFLGQYKMPIGIDTVRELLIEEKQEKPSAPADIVITNEEVVEKTE